jgi:hypothetical protein
MLNLVTWILLAVRSVFDLAFPMFSRARSHRAEQAHPVGRWLGRSLLGGLVLLALWLLNQEEAVGLKYWIPVGPLGEFWLPLLALSLYLMVWLGWWLYRVLNLRVVPLGSDFPEIDEAWDQALKALREADISLDNTPLFLVLGRAAGPDEALFRAAGLKAKVKQAPPGPDRPLHVTATRDGVWVTCPGVSALAQSEPVPAGSTATAGLDSLVESPGGGVTTSGAAGATIRIENIHEGGVERFVARYRREAVKKSVDLKQAEARLRHLCRLITRDRLGLCPVNGVLTLLPVDAADPGSDAAAIAGACRSDLTAAFDALRVRCPVLFLVCGLEKLEGFEELVERQPARQSENRLGQRFPLVHEVGPDNFPARVRSSVEWCASALLPSMVLSLYSVERPGGEGLADVVRANGRLYRFMRALRTAQEPLARLVSESIPSLPGEPIWYGGCYFAGTGEGANQQAFAAGVFLRMVQDQDRVTWTEDCLREDASAHHLARVCKTALIAIIALCGVVAAVLILTLVFSRGGDESLDAWLP